MKHYSLEGLEYIHHKNISLYGSSYLLSWLGIEVGLRISWLKFKKKFFTSK